MDFNEVFIEGRLTEDALQEQMPNGVMYVTFTLACNEDKRIDGNWQKRCQFVPIAVYGNYAMSLLPALRKSQRAIVLGKIEANDNRFVVNAMKVRICSGSRQEDSYEQAGSAGVGLRAD